MSTKKPRGPKPLISDETKAAILAADPTISNCELARMYSISEYLVRSARLKAGIVSKARGKTKTSAAKPRPVAAKAAKKPAKAAKRANSEQAVDADTSWSITFKVTAKHLDSWWQSLSIDLKAAIFESTATFESIFEPQGD